VHGYRLVDSRLSRRELNGLLNDGLTRLQLVGERRVRGWA
jgi:hypothetical protein